MSLNKKQHYKQQISYFGKEFSTMSDYKLHLWQKSYIDKIKKHFLDKNFQNKTLIDIGTGHGYVAVEMAKLGMNVIACDLTRESLDNIKRFKTQFKLSNIKLIECKAEDIPLKAKSVDYIVANAILEHIPQEKKAIEEWKRILKPNGKLFITVPLKYRYILPFFWLINYIHDKRIGHLRRYDLPTLQSKFQLEYVKHFYTGHFEKVIGAVLSILLKTDKYNKHFEQIDKKKQNKKYGSSNISVIFKR
jgi:ubiquinone/menaquinone biosynthesis C-methylase UbiE